MVNEMHLLSILNGFSGRTASRLTLEGLNVSNEVFETGERNGTIVIGGKGAMAMVSLTAEGKRVLASVG